jgi:hypothetical protein
MFEMGARPHPRATLSSLPEQSDIFIGIYWQRYGWIAPDMEISGLEDEYRLSGDRPKLIYIKSAAPEREPRLKALLDRVKNEGVSYKPFSTAAELRGLIADDLAMLLTERFAQGSEPRASAATSPSELPTGAVTFLFSDIEGATHLASTLKSDYSDLLKAHRAILRDAYSKHHGWEIRAEGDSFFVVFASPSRGREGSGDSPRTTGRGRAPTSSDGLRTGETDITGADYGGSRSIEPLSSPQQPTAGRCSSPGALWPPQGRSTGWRHDAGSQSTLKDFSPRALHQAVIDGLPAGATALRASPRHPEAGAPTPAA